MDTVAFDDDRYKWIRQRIALTLSIPLTTIDAHFTSEENIGIKAKKDILSFFSNHYSAGSTIFFSNYSEVEEGRNTVNIKVIFFLSYVCDS